MPKDGKQSISKAASVLSASIMNYDSPETAVEEKAEKERIGLMFREITLTVQKKKWFGLKDDDEVVHILKGVNGYALPGQLTAIMGGSGAGKTSLLNVISQRVFTGKFSGEVSLLKEGGVVPVQDNSLKDIAGYVVQEDYLFPSLTVKETLGYYADLRLPHEKRERREKKLQKVIHEMRLGHVVDTKIGNEFIRGISGGEKRRVSIAIQMLTSPSILFLDEPTSGLDSTNAHHLVHTLLRLARKGRTIICTVHQPRSDIFKLFDQVMLLCRGEVAYFGKAREMVDHFELMGHICPLDSNPADFASKNSFLTF